MHDKQLNMLNEEHICEAWDMVDSNEYYIYRTFFFEKLIKYLP